jgi:nicotinate-nucleotide adenylyltransferase
MVELAIASNPHFALSRVDVNRPAPSYTVEMLELLRAEWGPGPRFFFIEGPDSLSDIVCWYQPHRLIDLCELAVVARPGSEVDLAVLERQLPGLTDRIHWVEMPLLEISSTDVRARLRTGRPISYLLPHAVEVYIRQHGLYME